MHPCRKLTSDKQAEQVDSGIRSLLKELKENRELVYDAREWLVVGVIVFLTLRAETFGFVKDSV